MKGNAQIRSGTTSVVLNGHTENPGDVRRIQRLLIAGTRCPCQRPYAVLRVLQYALTSHGGGCRGDPTLPPSVTTDVPFFVRFRE